MNARIKQENKSGCFFLFWTQCVYESCKVTSKWSAAYNEEIKTNEERSSSDDDIYNSTCTARASYYDLVVDHISRCKARRRRTGALVCRHNKTSTRPVTGIHMVDVKHNKDYFTLQLLSIRGSETFALPRKLPPSRIVRQIRDSASFQKIPSLVGRLGSGVRVNVNVQIFSSAEIIVGGISPKGLSQRHGALMQTPARTSAYSNFTVTNGKQRFVRPIGRTDRRHNVFYLSVRSFVRPSVRPLPDFWTRYCENEWTDFDAN